MGPRLALYVLSVVAISFLGQGECQEQAGKSSASKSAAPVEQPPVILLTGFEPFGAGRPPNASWEGVKQLDGQAWQGHRLMARQLQVVWGQPLKQLRPLIAELKPVAIFSFGQGAGFTIEVKAANRRGGGRDNRGALAANPTVTADGPAEFAASIDAASLAKLLASKGYPIRISTAAGSYLCEECLYTLEYLKKTNDLPATTVLFSHVPALDGDKITPSTVQQYVLHVLEAWKTVYQPKADASQSTRRPRARELGISIGILATGELNAITDVAGVQVGHCSIVKGDDVRTGVTAILPHDGNLFQTKVPAALHVANGFGKFVGSTQIAELGVIETPIVLTNTLSTFAAADAVARWTLGQKGNEQVRSVNPVVGECNDGSLNDIRGQHVSAADVVQAIESAKPGVVAEGCVGAGVGTRCLGWKGGIGSSSRKLPKSLGSYTVGVLVQTNFDGQLTVAGAPVGRELGRYYLQDVVTGQEHGSCIVIVATDAPLDARQLGRLAERATLGLGAVGSPITHGSGDYILAFSTEKTLRRKFTSDEAIETLALLRDDRLSPLFQAVREATEEAVINSLLRATTTQGRAGQVVEAIDPAEVARICRKYGVLRP